MQRFQRVYESAKNPDSVNHAASLALYEFYLDVPGQALELYNKWKAHPFMNSRLYFLKNEVRGGVLPDGLAFPILAAMSAFAKPTREGWRVEFSGRVDVPDLEATLCSAGMFAFDEIAERNPQVMGNSHAAYSTVQRIAALYKRLT